MRCVQTIVVLIATGALLLTSAGHFSAAVLCQGLDGHVKIEAATLGVCVSDAVRSDETGTVDETAYSISQRDNHCGPCVDIPLAIGVGTASRVTGHDTRIEVKAPTLSALLEMNVRATTSVSPGRSGQGETIASPLLVNLRSVTLLV